MNNKLKIVFCSVFAGLMLWLCVATTCVACQLLPKNTKNNYIEAREIYLQSETGFYSTGNKSKIFYSRIEVEYDTEEKWISATADEYDNFEGATFSYFYTTRTIDSNDSDYDLHLRYWYTMLKLKDSDSSDYSYYKVGYKIVEHNKLHISFESNTLSFMDRYNNLYTLTIESNAYKQFDEKNRIVEIKTNQFDLKVKY